MSRKPTLPAAVSWGDLLTFQALPGAGTQAAEATVLLGLPPVVLPERAAGSTGKGGLQKDKLKPIIQSTSASFRLPLRMPLGLVVEQSDARPQTARPLDLPLWGPQEAAEVEAMLQPSGLPPPEPQTLLDLPKSMALCRRALAQTHAMGLDIDQTVTALARGRWPQPLPQQWQRKRLKQAHIGIDVHAARQFLVDDYCTLLQALNAQFPGLQLHLCELDTPSSWSQWAVNIEMADPSSPVFIVCELSMLPAPERQQMDRLAHRLQRLGRRVVWPMAWQSSLHKSAEWISELSADSRVSTLLACLSPAVTVEPGLVRAMVAAMGCQADSLALEHAIWSHAAMDGALPFRQWYPAAQRLALTKLSGLGENIQSRCWPLIAQHHVHRHQVQRDQELLNWVSAVGTAVHAFAVPELQLQAVKTRYGRVAQHLLNLWGQQACSPGHQQNRSSGLVVAAAHERLQTLPPCLRAQKDVEDMLAKAALPGLMGPGRDTSASNWQAPRSREMSLRLQGQSLCIVGSATPERPGLHLVDVNVNGDWVRVDIDDGRHRVLALSERSLEHAPLALQEWSVTPPKKINVSGTVGALSVCALSRPHWATSFCQSAEGLRACLHWPDGRGLWLEFPVPKSTHVDMRVADWVVDVDPHGPVLTWRPVALGTLNSSVSHLAFRYLPPATFIMGSPDSVGHDSEHPQHPVTLTHALWLAEAPCTQALWQAVMGQNPSHFKNGPEAPQRPVENVSWDDVQQFLARLNALLPEGSEAVLPTEAQWEYACRAGTATAYWWGDVPDDSKANFYTEGGKVGDEERGTTPVGCYPPNPWGLRDMHGNVWEWCADRKQRTYEQGTARDPIGDTRGGARVVRGGSWGYRPDFARSAFRRGWLQGFHSQILGFRFALRYSSPKGAEPQPGGLKASGGKTNGGAASGKATRATPKQKGAA